MLQEVMQEVFDVAHARNIALPDDVIDKTLAFMDGLPQGGTASMQRDIMEGRPSELDAQIGAAVRLGQAAGVATPLNTFIYNSLLPLELKARGQVQFTI
jgi:2-dehydropantoate 2-reductase